MKKIAGVLVGLLCSAIANAGNAYSNEFYEVYQVVPYSSTSTLYQHMNGSTLIKFTEAIEWTGAEGCDEDGIVIRNEDEHLLSILMTAWASGKKMRVYADTSEGGIVNGRCYARAIAVR